MKLKHTKMGRVNGIFLSIFIFIFIHIYFNIHIYFYPCFYFIGIKPFVIFLKASGTRAIEILKTATQIDIYKKKVRFEQMWKNFQK